MMSDPEKGPDPNGLQGKMEMVKEADKALHPPVMPAPTPAPVKTSVKDKVNPSGKYGDKPGEKRIDTAPMVKPLGKMHKGGTVPKTGPYIMKAGEKVLTPEKHDKLKAALDMAKDAMAHGEPDADDMMPAKKVKRMSIRKADKGGFIMNHMHHPPHEMPEHDEEHITPDMDGLKAHLDQHFGE